MGDPGYPRYPEYPLVLRMKTITRLAHAPLNSPPDTCCEEPMRGLHEGQTMSLLRPLTLNFSPGPQPQPGLQAPEESLIRNGKQTAKSCWTLWSSIPDRAHIVNHLELAIKQASLAIINSVEIIINFAP